MIVFACLFIVAYVSTWVPMVWTVTGEMFPYRHRATCMSISTASNWTWNFLLAFFIPFITSAIDFRYGYVFAACCLAAALTVYFFMLESSGTTLEEIDTIYVLHMKLTQSSKWQVPEGEDLEEVQRAATGEAKGKVGAEYMENGRKEGL